MDRTTFSDGYLVNKSDLNNIEDSLIFHQLSRFTDGAIPGVFTGLTVSVNTVNHRLLDVTSGRGYCPNGEYVELTTYQSSIPLSSSTGPSILNYVCLVYTEYASQLKPHETNGTTSYARANRSIRLRIYTAAEYTALASSDSNLANDAKDRILLLAKVTDPGSPAGLSSSNIQSPSVFSNINFASAPINVTGVTIKNVSGNTNTGTGTLTFVQATPSLQWHAPGSLLAGTAVTLTGDGTYTLTGGDGSTITVTVIMTALAASNTSDTITITNLYNQNIPRFSEIDNLHRNLLGTGTPTPTNPHGLTVGDIGATIENDIIIHQDVQHTNGIARSVSSTACMALAVDASTAPDRLLITSPSGTDTYYVNGKRLSAISSTVMTFTTGVSDRFEIYEIYATDSGTVSRNLRANTASATPNITGLHIVDLSETFPAGSINIAYSLPGAVKTLTLGSGTGVSVTEDQIYRLWHANGRDWMDVYTKIGSMPVAGQVDSITISAVIDKEINFLIGKILWSGTSTGFLGYGNVGGSGSPVDNRIFGTLTDAEMGSDYELERLEGSWREILHPGVIEAPAYVSRFALSSPTGLSQPVSGGVAYVRGKRFKVANKTVTLTNNTTNIAYVDASGVIQVVNSASTSLVKILGGYNSGTSVPQISGRNSSNGLELGCPLWLITTSGGVVTKMINVKRRLDHIGDNRSPTGFSVGEPTGEFSTLDGAYEYAKAWFSVYAASPGGIFLNVIGYATLTETISSSGFIVPLFIQGLDDPPGDGQARQSNVLISGTGFTNAIFDFNTAAGGCIKNLVIVGDFSSLSNVPLVRFYNAYRSMMSGVKTLFSGLAGSNHELVRIEGNCSFITIRDNRIGRCFRGIHFEMGNNDISYIRIEGNILTGCYYYGILFNSSFNNNKVTNLWIENNRIEAEPSGYSWVGIRGTKPSFDSVWIRGNKIVSTGFVPASGVGDFHGYIDLGNAPTYPANCPVCKDIWIEDNYLSGMYTQNAVVAYQYGISCINFESDVNGPVYIINNTIELNGSGIGYGINTIGQKYGLHITDNTVINPVAGGSPGHVGIQITKCDRFTCRGNRVTGPNMGFGIGAYTTAQGVISGNVMGAIMPGSMALYLNPGTSFIFYGGNSVALYGVVNAEASNTTAGNA